MRTQLQVIGVKKVMYLGGYTTGPTNGFMYPRLQELFPVVRFTSVPRCLSLQATNDRSHAHIRGRGSVSDSVPGTCNRKSHVFGGLYQQNPQMDLCTLDFKDCSRSFVLLLCPVACPSRSLLTGPVLTSGGAGLCRTQFQQSAIEKVMFSGGYTSRTHKWIHVPQTLGIVPGRSFHFCTPLLAPLGHC